LGVFLFFKQLTTTAFSANFNVISTHRKSISTLQVVCRFWRSG